MQHIVCFKNHNVNIWESVGIAMEITSVCSGVFLNVKWSREERYPHNTYRMSWMCVFTAAYEVNIWLRLPYALTDCMMNLGYVLVKRKEGDNTTGSRIHVLKITHKLAELTWAGGSYLVALSDRSKCTHRFLVQSLSILLRKSICFNLSFGSSNGQPKSS